MDYTISESQVIKIWQSCKEKGINQTINKPITVKKGRKLKEILKKNRMISIFQVQTKSILKLIKGAYFFMLFDTNLTLISINSNIADNNFYKKGIKPGVSFQESSCGLMQFHFAYN